jgi:hypothetical protein
MATAARHPLSFGLYADGFEIAHPEEGLQSRETITVRNSKRDVTIECGPLKMASTVYQTVYMLRINYREIENRHAESLPLAGFGSCLSFDYSEALQDLVYRWCETNGFTVNREVNHWPVLQFLLVTKESGSPAFDVIAIDPKTKRVRITKLGVTRETASKCIHAIRASGQRQGYRAVPAGKYANWDVFQESSKY